MAVITISRQFGAGGITVGEIVAQKLGYKFFDNEIIQMLAKEAKVSTHWVEDLEKEAGGALQKFLSQVVPKSMVERILDRRPYSPFLYNRQWLIQVHAYCRHLDPVAKIP